MLEPCSLSPVFCGQPGSAGTVNGETRSPWGSWAWAYVRPVFRWGAAGAFAWLGWRSLVLAAYHGWAADFPPKEIAAWHEQWSNVFFFGTLFSWVCAGSCIWLLRRGPPAKAA